MSVRAYLKNMTEDVQEIVDVGITVFPATLYDLRHRSAPLLAESAALLEALQTDVLRLVALNQTTEYGFDTAVAILHGADPDNPLTWGPHILLAQHFRERFTLAEQVAIVGATHTDDEVKNFYDHLHMSYLVDLNNVVTSMGLDVLIAKQLLSEARKAEILGY